MLPMLMSTFRSCVFLVSQPSFGHPLGYHPGEHLICLITVFPFFPADDFPNNLQAYVRHMYEGQRMFAEASSILNSIPPVNFVANSSFQEYMMRLSWSRCSV